MHYILLCRSLSSAQKAVRILQNQGIYASVVKAPQSAHTDGCAYGVKIAERNLQASRDILYRSGISIRKTIEAISAGNTREVWR